MGQPRHELKFFIALRDAPILEAKLSRALLRDPNAGPAGEYMVRSLYFDDAFNSAYNDKLDGVMNRDKYRIRVYNLSDRAIYLERKRKVGDLIQKDDVRITKRLCHQLTEGDPTGLQLLQHPLLNDLFVQMRLKCLRPVVIVDYERAAFVHPGGHVRITLDKRVRSGVGNLDIFHQNLQTVPAIDPEKMVLEVKYNEYLPDFIPPILSGFPAERSAISKYVLCRRFGF